jgi:YD repeat-containing protein
LYVDGKVVNYATATVNKARFWFTPDRQGDFQGLQGRVRLKIPPRATQEPLLLDIREPAPQSLHGLSLSWHPVEIVAVGKTTQRNVHLFNAPLTIQIQYDEAEIQDVDENSLTIYYFDPEQDDWFPLKTQVDTQNNLLTAQSDHLTVFDYKANHWQSQSLPTVDAFKVADFTGAGTYAIDFWTPPGPGGLRPSLQLTYNSQVFDESSAFSQASWVGMGWSLDTGAITRNMHGTDSDTNDDTFLITVNGVSSLLLPIQTNGNIVTYNTADQTFMKVEFDKTNHTWTAWDKEGTKYVFSTRARTNSTDGCSSTLNLTWRWSLTTVTDVHNNTLSYSYYTEKKPNCSNEIAVYPSEINYSHGKYRILFERSPRSDYQKSWKSSDARTLYGTQRLSQIRIQQNVGGNWIDVRRYQFVYAPDDATTNVIYPNFKWSAGGKTLTLRGVQEFGLDGSALPAVEFTYDDNMHLTKVDNGQGGQVQLTYQRLAYFDDINKDLRALSTSFGSSPNDECWYNGGFRTGTAWTKTRGTYVGCYWDGSRSYLRVWAAVGQRPIPENIAKPGARYRLHIEGNVGPTKSSTDVNWGFRETTTNRDVITYSDNLSGNFTLEQSFEMPSYYDPRNTRLYLECDDCLITKYQFVLFPMYYRVTKRTVTIQPTGVVSNYTYHYLHFAPNSSDNSEAAAKYGNNNNANNALYTQILRENRGHAMSAVHDPSGLTTLTWFAQSDALKGRAYDTLVLKENFYDSMDEQNNNWVASGGTHSAVALYQRDWDRSIESINPNADWNVSYCRATASLNQGEVAIAHVRLRGANAQGQISLTGGGQPLILSLNSSGASVNGIPLLASGSFIRNEWYAVMIFIDAVNGFRVRIWQLDNPANAGEAVLPALGSGPWTFCDRVNNGRIYLDGYFEGIPYTETITRFASTVQYDTITNNGIPDLAALTKFKDLQVVWNRPISIEKRIYNGDAAFAGTRQTYEYDAYGNVISVTDWAGQNNEWTPYRATYTEYYPNATTYVISKPARQATYACSGTDCSATLLAEKLYFYDGSATYTTPPTRGDLTTQRLWAGGGDYIQTSYTYDSYGNRISESLFTEYATVASDPPDTSRQTTLTTYDPEYHTYAISVQNPLGHVTQTEYNYALGLPIRLTDPNGAITSATYDGFGRLTTITAPGDASPTLQVVYHDARIPFQVDLQQRVDDSASIRLSHFYDGAGHLIQTQTVGAIVNGSPQNVVVDYQYDSLGRLIRQTVPYAIAYNAAPTFVSQTFTQPSTQTTYDAFGRTETVTAPNGNQTHYAYTDLSTTLTDARGHATTTYSDVWGRRTRLQPPEGPAVLYAYDALDRLTSVTRGPATTTLTYDPAGRKIALAGPDMGSWSYTYDAAGNLRSQSDARGCTLTFSYDPLNRLIAKNSSGDCGAPLSVTYAYDQGPNGLGRRTAMSDPSGTTSWSYDARGRLITEVKTIASQSFTTSWSYNSADLPVSMTYPDGEVLTYLYNPDGTLRSLLSSTGETYLAEMRYDESARPIRLDLGPSLLRKSLAYFPWDTPRQGGNLAQILTTRLADGLALQNLTYAYDAAGNITQIADNLAGETHLYAYDALDRLTAWTLNGVTETYAYDPARGNLTRKGDLRLAYDDPAHPHAVTAAGANRYAYDANGNQITRWLDDQLYTLAYDAENRLIAVSLSAAAPTPTPLPTETPTLAPTKTPTPETPTPTETPVLDTPTPTIAPTETPIPDTPTPTETPPSTPQRPPSPRPTPLSLTRPRPPRPPSSTPQRLPTPPSPTPPRPPRPPSSTRRRLLTPPSPTRPRPPRPPPSTPQRPPPRSPPRPRPLPPRPPSAAPPSSTTATASASPRPSTTSPLTSSATTTKSPTASLPSTTTPVDSASPCARTARSTTCSATTWAAPPWSPMHPATSSPNCATAPGAKRAIIQVTPPPAINTPANTPTPPTSACTFTTPDGMTRPWDGLRRRIALSLRECRGWIGMRM